MSEFLVKVSRGGHGESYHSGSIAVVDHRGNLLDRVGDPDFSTFLRSCAKPPQALPIVESGAAERFGFTPAEKAPKQTQDLVLKFPVPPR
jgi:L-asparaginase II